MTESTKSYGADIRCVVCGAMPYPTDPAVRECFELRRFNAAGEISESPAVGSWYCLEHAPAKSKRAARAVRGSPLEALAEFELLLADESARLMGMFPDDGNAADAEAAFDTYRREIERGLGQLKATIALHVKLIANGTPKPRRSRQKAMATRERNAPGQINLIEEEPMAIRDTS
jgi:hypothetical protein